MKAQVKLSTGRLYLDVSGVAVTMQGDPCRDAQFPDNQWTDENLEEAARIINESNLAT